MLNKNINNIIIELQKYKREKPYLIEYYLNERLDKSLNTYINNINSIVNRLASKDSLKVLKIINKDY